MMFCDTTAGIGATFQTHERNAGRTESRTGGMTDGQNDGWMDRVGS